jgi:predicted kinase
MNPTQPELILTIGIQAAGKSTWCREHLWHTHMRLNRDLLRTAHREDVLFHAGLAVGASMVIDNTNVTAKARARYIRAALAADYIVAAAYFPIAPDEALKRNASRPGKQRVPDRAILGTLAKLEPPTPDEGFTCIQTIEAP